MTHPLLRKLAALADEDGLEDITQLFAAPGRSTLTSKLPPRPSEAAPIVINVADAESARALGDTILVAARAKFQRATDMPEVEGPAKPGFAAVPGAPKGVAGAKLEAKAKTAKLKVPGKGKDRGKGEGKGKAIAPGLDKPALATKQGGPLKLRADGTPSFKASDPGSASARPTRLAPAERTAQAVEDPFAMHLLPALAADVAAVTAPDGAAALPGFERAPLLDHPVAAATSIPGVDAAFPQAAEDARGAEPALGQALPPGLEDLFEQVGFGAAQPGDALAEEPEEAPSIEEVAPPAASKANARALEADATDDVEAAPGRRPAKVKLGRATSASDDSARSFRAAKPDDARPAMRPARPDRAAPALRAAAPDGADAPAFHAARADGTPPAFRAAKPDGADAPAFRAAKPDGAAQPDGAAPAFRAAAPDGAAPARDPVKLKAPGAAEATNAEPVSKFRAAKDGADAKRDDDAHDRPSRGDRGKPARGEEHDDANAATDRGFRAAKGKGEKGGPAASEPSGPIDQMFDSSTPFSGGGGAPAATGPAPTPAPASGGGRAPAGPAPAPRRAAAAASPPIPRRRSRR